MGFYDILFTLAVHHDFEAKKLGVSLSDIDNACFLWGDLQFQPFGNPPCDSLHGLLRVLSVPAEDTEVIRIAHNEHFFEIAVPHFLVALALVKDLRGADGAPCSVAVRHGVFRPLAVDPVIQLIEHHICQQRGNDPALGRSLCRVNGAAVRHTDGSLQDAPDDKQKLFVLDAQRPELLDKFAVVHIVKESLMSNSKHSANAPVAAGSKYGKLRVPLTDSGEPIAVVAELCLTDGFQDLFDALLHQSVPDARNTQRPGFAVWFWDVLPAHWFGTVAVFAACDDFLTLPMTSAGGSRPMSPIFCLSVPAV